MLFVLPPRAMSKKTMGLVALSSILLSVAVAVVVMLTEKSNQVFVFFDFDARYLIMPLVMDGILVVELVWMD